MTRLLTLFSAAVFLLTSAAAHAASEQVFPAQSALNQASAIGHAEGTIVGVDTEHARITLKHGAIRGLGMPAMTMVFRVADPAMLVGVKPGDTVAFSLTRVDNFFTVTQLTPFRIMPPELPSSDGAPPRSEPGK